MLEYPKKYDIIVIGGGHAGCEAALAAARMGFNTLLLTLYLDSIALMACNPSIGGPGKGHLVREIDALGGEMGRNIDETMIHIRILNESKGPAVQAYRAQADKREYHLRMKHVLENQKNLDIKQGMVEEILVENGKVIGVGVREGWVFKGRCVIVATGVYLRGLVHIGLTHFESGPLGETAAWKLSESLRKLGLKLGRLKTGTCARIDGKTIDFSSLVPQSSAEEPLSFSFRSEKRICRGYFCWMTKTNERTHEIIRNSLDRSPLFTGVIEGRGPRYCPSIEDKVVRFPDRNSHTVFLEPEGRRTLEFYLQNFSTSLPVDVQIKMVRTLPGLEKAEIMRPGYAIEYDFVFPTQLKPSLETKDIDGLFMAGQINGTSGYEEAAAQGLVAGINAALKLRGEEPLILNRAEAYIGVLIDDLVTKGTEEPYRILTSRAEYRLLLRQDNADFRLMPYGYKVGLIRKDEYERFLLKKRRVEKEIERLNHVRIPPTDKVNELLRSLGSSPIDTPVTLAQLLKRPEVTIESLSEIDPSYDNNLSYEEKKQVEVEIKYEGYIKRELSLVEQFKKMENRKIPPDIDYDAIPGLSNEGREKLKKIKPISIGQASRISGVSPADISLLTIYLSTRGQSSS